jgi:uncharacterized membrane protein
VNLEDYRTLFMVGSLVLILVAASPGLSVVVPFPRGGERFSELWLLGPEHMAEGYPFNVRAGEVQGPVYLGVRNHMGSSQYYLVYVKFRNQSQPLPNSTSSEPSPLSALYEFRFFLAEGEMWETPVRFIIEDGGFEGNRSFVAGISINGHVCPVDLSSSWDSENEGFYYQLFFELWRYSGDREGFWFHNRFVGIWLNMTSV